MRNFTDFISVIRTKKKGLHLPLWGGGIALCLVLSGCSPGSFFGNQKDQAVINQKKYSKLNPDCSKVKLNSAALDTATLKGFVQCFNDNGSIDPLAKLVGTLNEKQLQAVVRTVNQSVLTDHKAIYFIDTTYDSLSQMSLLKEAFTQFGQLLKNDEFLTRSLVLFKGAYLNSGVTPDGSNKTLKAIELLAHRWTYHEWKNLIELALSLSSSKPFQAFIGELKSGKSSSVSFEDSIRYLTYYLYESHVYQCSSQSLASAPVPISRELSATFKSGLLFQTLNELLGKNEFEIQSQIPKISAIFEASFQKDLNPNGFKKLASAFHNLQHEPISCMSNVVEIPDAAMHLIREMSILKPGEAAEYTLRKNPLTLSLLQPFCSFPKGLDEHYSALTTLSKIGMVRSDQTVSVLEPMQEMIQTLYKPTQEWLGCPGQVKQQSVYHPMATLLENFLGDEGTNRHPALGSSPGGVYNLMPLLARTTDLGLWKSLLLVSSLPSNKQQQDIKEMVDFFTRSQDVLQGASIYEVLVESNFTEKGLVKLQDVLLSLTQFLTLDTDYLEKIFRTLRKVHYANNVHPFLDITFRIAQNATANSDLFETLFEIADKPEFTKAIQFLSETAKDGRLEDLAGASIKLFHRFAEEVKNDYVVEAKKAPRFSADRRHNLIENQLEPYSLRPMDVQTFGLSSGCNGIKMEESLLNAPPVTFDHKLKQLLSCYQIDLDPRIHESLSFLNEHKTESTHHSQGTSFLNFQVNSMKSLFDKPLDGGVGVTKEELVSLLDSALDSLQDGQFKNLTGLFPLLVNQTYSVPNSENLDISGENSGPVIQPLLKLTSTFMSSSKNRSDWKVFERYGADFIERPDFSSHLTDLHALIDRASDFGNEREKEIQKKAEQRGSSDFANACDPDQPLSESMRKFLNRIVLTQYPDLSWDAEERPFAFLEKIGRWIDVKECETLSADPALRKRQIYTRACEVVQAAMVNANNIDFDEAQNQGRQSWKLDEVKALLQPVLKKIKNPADNNPKRSLISAHVNFLKYFDVPPQKQQLGIAESRFSPETLLNWLFDRSVDYKLITYYYLHETEVMRKGKKVKIYTPSPHPRVRLVNTLDRLELVLYLTDFAAPPPISKNLALQFLSELSEGWGNEPSSHWPKEISAHYSSWWARLRGAKPATLLYTVQGIVDREKTYGTLFQLEDLGSLSDEWVGLPPAPSCSVHSFIPSDIPIDRPSKIKDLKLKPWLGKLFIDETEIPGMRARLYNLWQVQSVLKENSPHSGVGFGAIPGNPGLEILRNMFFEIYYSNNSKNRKSREGENNNLIATLQSVRGGLFRQMGRLIQHAQIQLNANHEPLLHPDTGLPILNDPKLSHLFASLVHSAQIPAMNDLLVSILAHGKVEDSELVYKILEPIFEIVQESEDPRATPDVRDKKERMKELVVNSMAVLNRLQEWWPGRDIPLNQDILNLGMSRLNEVIEDLKPFLVSEGGAQLVKDLLTSQGINHLTSVLYQFDSSDSDQPGAVLVGDQAKYQQRRHRLFTLMKELLCDPSDPERCGFDRAIYPLPLQTGISALKTVYGHKENRTHLHSFLDRLNMMSHSEGYQRLQVRDAIRPLLLFFEKQDAFGQARSADDQELAEKLGKYLAKMMRSGDLDQFLILAQEYPDDFYKVLSTLSAQLEGGDFSGIEDLLKMMKRTLSETEN